MAAEGILTRRQLRLKLSEASRPLSSSSQEAATASSPSGASPVALFTENSFPPPSQHAPRVVSDEGMKPAGGEPMTRTLSLKSFRNSAKAAGRAAIATLAAMHQMENSAAQSQQREAQQLRDELVRARHADRIAMLRADRHEDFRRTLDPKNEDDKAIIRVVDFFAKEVERVVTAVEKSTSGAKQGKRSTNGDTSAAASTGPVELPANSRDPPTMDGSLLPFQRRGVAFLVKNLQLGLNCILADEMGLGKTVQTIALLLWASRTHEGECTNERPHLVTAPLSTIPNWESELERFAPSLNVVSLSGNGDDHVAKALKRRKRDGRPAADVVLIPHHSLAKKKGGCYTHLSQIKWGCMVLDESHRIKNSDSVLHQKLHAMESSFRLALTGTPLQNDLGELFTLLAFLLPSVFSSSKNADLNAVITQILGARAKTDQETEKQFVVCRQLHRLLEPFMLRRERSEVMSQLPKKDEHVIICPLSDMQSEAMAAIAQDATILTPVIEYRKATIHPYTRLFEFQINEGVVTNSGKFEAVDLALRFLLPRRHKTLIFSCWTTVLDVVETHMMLRKWEYVRLDGRVKGSERQALIDKFNDHDSGVDVFLISKIAGGVGLNLQAADTVILLDTDYNPQRDNQALSRAYRVGQERHVKVLWLKVDNEVETRINAVADSKTALEQKAIHAGLFDSTSSSTAKEERLADVLKAGNGDVVRGRSLRQLHGQLRAALPRGEDETEAAMAFFSAEDEKFRATEVKRSRSEEDVGRVDEADD